MIVNFLTLLVANIVNNINLTLFVIMSTCFLSHYHPSTRLKFIEWRLNSKIIDGQRAHTAL